MRRTPSLALGFLAVCLQPLASAPARGQQPAAAAALAVAENPELSTPTAPVEVDGTPLFRVRGMSSLPAAQRARAIADRIEAIADDPTIRSESLRTADVDGTLQIVAGDRLVMAVLESDARVEGVTKPVLANAHLRRVREAVDQYRAARTRKALGRGLLLAGAAIVAFALAGFAVLWAHRRLSGLIETRFRQRVKGVGVKSFAIVRAERIVEGLHASLGVVRTVALLVFAFLCLHVVLGLFPWTHPISRKLTAYVARPLGLLLNAFVSKIPDLVFLAVLFLGVRYLLGLLHLFFEALERKTLAFKGFEPEWAGPTYKIVRLAVVAFSLVVAYPYIPGSDSAAFKGVSLFLGVVFSLGSSSVIANTIAGYTMTYRRAFHVGDRVRIGDVTGDVTEVRLQVTHIRTIKNEEIIVPNSQILGSNVVNYSSLAASSGLILHTTVGIGYETPWRQVEAMLLLAADRTPGFLKAPAPFVFLTALGDFCVTYELNVFCDTPQRMASLYAELHRRILDVFNEYGVQIMTPAYEADTEVPKVVPKEQWFMAPAAPEEPGRPPAPAGEKPGV